MRSKSSPPHNPIAPVVLFAGSLRAGQRAAAIMSLIQSAKLKGHDPYQYLKDVLERLPPQPASQIEEIMPHRWQTVHRAQIRGNEGCMPSDKPKTTS